MGIDLLAKNQSLVRLGNGKMVVGNMPLGESGMLAVGGLTAFGETQVAQYTPLAAWAFPYNISNLNYVLEEENGATVTHSGSFAMLQTGTAADGKSSLLTRRSVRYQPGIGGLVRFTAIFSAGVANSVQFVGYGDDDDGFFMGFVGTQFGVIRRSGGDQTFTPISEWTELENTPPAFDPTKLNVYQIQFQWLGGGEIRFFMEDNDSGGLSLVHRIKYTNLFTDVSIQNPSLPLHAHAENIGSTTNIILKTSSATAGLEGKDFNRTLNAILSSDNEKSIIIDTLTPIVSIRSPLVYEGEANRLSIIPLWAFVAAIAAAGNAICTFRILFNATLTGESFSQQAPGGAPLEEDVSATAVTGGFSVSSMPINVPGEANLNIIGFESMMVPGDILTIAALSSKAIEVAASITSDSEI